MANKAATLEFQRSLPAKRMGAGAVIRDDAGRVLLVNATYKDPWELPGGVVEAGESPASACRREIQEELGLEIEVGELVCVDYSSATAGYVESLMFLFEVPSLSSALPSIPRRPKPCPRRPRGGPPASNSQHCRGQVTPTLADSSHRSPAATATWSTT